MICLLCAKDFYVPRNRRLKKIADILKSRFLVRRRFYSCAMGHICIKNTGRNLALPEDNGKMFYLLPRAKDDQNRVK